MRKAAAFSESQTNFAFYPRRESRPAEVPLMLFVVYYEKR
jgi:hypothetical protein